MEEPLVSPTIPTSLYNYTISSFEPSFLKLHVGQVLKKPSSILCTIHTLKKKYSLGEGSMIS